MLLRWHTGTFVEQHGRIKLAIFLKRVIYWQLKSCSLALNYLLILQIWLNVTRKLKFIHMQILTWWSSIKIKTESHLSDAAFRLIQSFNLPYSFEVLHVGVHFSSNPGCQVILCNFITSTKFRFAKFTA